MHKEEALEWYAGKMDEGSMFSFLRSMHTRHPSIPEMKPNPKARQRHDKCNPACVARFLGPDPQLRCEATLTRTWRAGASTWHATRTAGTQTRTGCGPGTPASHAGRRGAECQQGGLRALRPGADAGARRGACGPHALICAVLRAQVRAGARQRRRDPRRHRQGRDRLQGVVVRREPPARAVPHSVRPRVRAPPRAPPARAAGGWGIEGASS